MLVNIILRDVPDPARHGLFMFFWTRHGLNRHGFWNSAEWTGTDRHGFWLDRHGPARYARRRRPGTDRHGLFLCIEVWSEIPKEQLTKSPVLSGATWSYLVPSGPLWPHRVLSSASWSYLDLSGAMPFYLVLSRPIWSYIALSGPIWWDWLFDKLFNNFAINHLANELVHSLMNWLTH